MLKLCRCGAVAPLANKCCDKCRSIKSSDEKERQKHYDLNRRDTKSKNFYNSKSWKVMRSSALIRDNFLCMECLKNKNIREATCVDHIVPIKIDWTLRLDIDNLRSLCDKCHRIKTQQDKVKYRELR